MGAPPLVSTSKMSHKKNGSNPRLRFGSTEISLQRRATPSSWETSIQFQQVREHLVNVAFPFRNVCDGQDGVHAVVSAGVNGFDKEAVDFENAQNVAVLDDALRQADAVVPHVGRFLVEWESIESIEFHD